MVYQTWLTSNRCISIRKIFNKGGVIIGPTFAPPHQLLDFPCPDTSSYRSELSGLVALLFLSTKICSFHNISSGGMTIYCDSKKALCNVFQTQYTGISPFLDPDFDLIIVAKNLLQNIPIVICNEWVEHHSTSQTKSFPEEMNIMADQLAGDYATNPHSSLQPQRMPIPHPDYKVRLIYNKSTITIKLNNKMHSALHSTKLQDHITRKAKWSPSVFNLFNWDSHGQSFIRLTRNGKIHTAKITHQLVNTNRLSHLYYGTLGTCPCCLREEETFNNVLNCDSPSSVKTRSTALALLLETLQCTNTPRPILKAIQHGFTHWESNTNPARIWTLTRGSLHADDTLLTVVFTEQYHSIGWCHFLLSRISGKWEKAYMAYLYQNTLPAVGQHWASVLITSLWTYTRTLWNHRNLIMHGPSELAAQKLLRESYSEVKDLFQEYQDNPNT